MISEAARSNGCERIIKERPAFLPGALLSSCSKSLLAFAFFVLQNMNDLQTVAFESFAYDPIAGRDDRKEELKEVEKHKEFGCWKQDFPKAAFRLNKAENTEANSPVQNGLQ